MGTTAEKLQKILDTKSALKTAINAKGGTITDTTLFSDYATQVNNFPTLTYWDGTYEESDGESYTLTFNAESYIYNYDYYFYSLDSGSTWNAIDSATMTVENVSKIRFKATSGTYGMNIGTSNGGSDIASIVNSETEDITVTANATWFFTYFGGGAGA